MAATQTSPSEEAIEIWTALGIPREAMASIRGANTFQEIRSLKQLMPELEDQRVGLLTSAYHLPRAMRLARAQGLHNLIPVAADYQASNAAPRLLDMIPNAASLAQWSRCQHEFMAWLVGR
jgi:uncharacterized SAM-binding protein YcdF (DUF218 family)